MQSVLDQQRRKSDTGNSKAYNEKAKGAGKEGAKYSTRTRAVQNKKDNAFEKMEHTLENTNNVLLEIKDSLQQTMKKFAVEILGIKNKEDKHRGRGHLAPEDRDMILKEARGRVHYNSYTDAILQSGSNKWNRFTQKYGTKRGWADTVLGAPKDNSWRAQGRQYQDALAQYQKDRMELQGDTLKKTYGGKKGAEAQIEKDFRMQQKLSKQIQEEEKEVLRKKNAGFTELDGVSKKLNELLDEFARHDPTNTGRYLEQKTTPNARSQPGVAGVMPSERFTAGQAVHRMYKEETPVSGETPKTVPSGVLPEEAATEAANEKAKDREETHEQTTILSKILDALTLGKKDDPVEGFSDGKPDKDFFTTLLGGAGLLGGILTAISGVGKGVGSLLSVVGSIAGKIGATVVEGGAAAVGLGVKAVKALVPNAGAAAGLGLGVAASLAGGYAADAVAGKLGVGKDDQGNDIKIDQKQDDKNWDKMSWLEKAESGTARGIEHVGRWVNLDHIADQAQADRIKNETQYLNAKDINTPGPRLTAQQIEQATAQNNDAKSDAAAPNVTVVAPSSNTTIAPASSDSSSGIMGTIRNTESTISNYIAKRYAP